MPFIVDYAQNYCLLFGTKEGFWRNTGIKSVRIINKKSRIFSFWKLFNLQIKYFSDLCVKICEGVN